MAFLSFVLNKIPFATLSKHGIFARHVPALESVNMFTINGLHVFFEAGFFFGGGWRTGLG